MTMAKIKIKLLMLGPKAKCNGPVEYIMLHWWHLSIWDMPVGTLVLSPGFPRTEICLVAFSA